MFGPLVTAMATPFDSSGDVDYKEAIRLAHYLIDNGTDMIVLAGTTGESPTLTHDEEFRLFEVIKKENIKVMAGTGSNSTATAIQSTREAEKLGVDAILQVVPYYNKPSQEGIYQHFKAVAESTSLPIMLYNIPGRTSKNMEPETVARLAKIKNIVALKEAAGSVEQMAKMRELTPPDFYIYSGDDALTLDFMEKGACGVVSVASHCAGLKIKKMMAERSRALHNELKPLFDVLFITSNPTPLKAALNMMGFNVGIPRLPLIEATLDEKAQVQAALKKLGLC